MNTPTAEILMAILAGLVLAVSMRFLVIILIGGKNG